ncbi:MAG TPA: GNAT family N-acetyltransferase [Streptosporangiaceae bacterium]
MDYRPYEHSDLPGIAALCQAEGWPSLPADLDRARRILTNPGVTTYVATEGGDVAGFIYLLSDGEVQAYIATMAVRAGSRGQGIGTRLIQEAFAACGAQRIDLLSGADGFYEKLLHQRLSGFRLYPPFAKDQQDASP